MRYYVVSDVHGFYTQLVEELDKAGFFEDCEPHKLVVCGDLLDKGQEARKMIDFMVGLLKKDLLIFVKGNHDELFVQCLQKILTSGVDAVCTSLSHHYRNGTWDTLLQISGVSESEAYNNPQALVEDAMHSPFYQTLLPHTVDYFETKRYIFVHGWIPCFAEGVKPDLQFSYNPDWREADRDGWWKASWYNGMDAACRFGVIEPGKTIVCGHKRASHGHAVYHGLGEESGEGAIWTPFYDNGIINVDASVKRSGKINCLVLEDEEME